MENMLSRKNSLVNSEMGLPALNHQHGLLEQVQKRQIKALNHNQKRDLNDIDLKERARGQKLPKAVPFRNLHKKTHFKTLEHIMVKSPTLKDLDPPPVGEDVVNP